MRKPHSFWIVLTVSFLVLLGLAMAGWWYLDKSLERKLQTFIQSHPGLSIEYSEIRTSALKRQIVLVQPRIVYGDDIEVQAGQAVFRGLNLEGGLPLRMSFQAVDMELTRFFPSAGLIKDIALSGSSLSGINAALQYEYNPETLILEIQNVSVESPDLGLFCSTLGISNLNFKYIMSVDNPFLLAAAVLGLRIDFFQAGYEDRGMMTRLDEFRTTRGVHGRKNDQQFHTEILGVFLEKNEDHPLRLFIQGQLPLTVILAPPGPVPLSAVLASESAGAAHELLGLQISNHEPEFCNQSW